MRVAQVFLGLTFVVCAVSGQQAGGPQKFVAGYLVANLPPPSNAKYEVWTVRDGMTGTDCSTGGGTNTVVCSSNGLVWTGLAGSGGSGSGTVTSVATTGPITGGPITASGTIACPSCVSASSPGVGVAHFAGSTQTVTSSTVSLTADVSGTLPAANGGTGTGTAPTSGQLAIGQSGGSYLPETASGSCTVNASGVFACSGSGLSGMTAGQVPIAATATTATSSKALAGSGTGITTGPTTSTNLDCANFNGTTGQIADSGGPCGSGSGTVTDGAGTTTANQIATTTTTTHQIQYGTALPNGTTATTQTPGDSTTKVATDAFVIANAGSGNPSTSTYCAMGDSVLTGSGVAAAASIYPIAAITAIAASGTTRTVTAANSYTAGTWVLLQTLTGSGVTDLATLQNFIGQVSATGLSTSQFEITVGTSATYSSTTATGYANYAFGAAQQASQLPFFLGHGSFYYGGQYESIEAMQAAYAASDCHANSPAVTSSTSPAYIFVDSPQAEWQQSSCPNPTTVEANYSAFWTTLHTDGWKIVQMAPVNFQFNTTLFCSTAPALSAAFNQWLYVQSDSTPLASGTAYFDSFADSDQVFNNYNNTVLFAAADNHELTEGGGAKHLGAMMGQALATKSSVAESQVGGVGAVLLAPTSAQNITPASSGFVPLAITPIDSGHDAFDVFNYGFGNVLFGVSSTGAYFGSSGTQFDVAGNSLTLGNGSYFGATYLVDASASGFGHLNIWSDNNGITLTPCEGGGCSVANSTLTLNGAAIVTNATIHSASTAPTASSGTLTGSNAGGFISGLSAATSVTITFANSGWSTWAACTATPSVTAITVYNSSQSATAVTFSFAALTGTLYYSCNGN